MDFIIELLKLKDFMTKFFYDLIINERAAKGWPFAASGLTCLIFAPIRYRDLSPLL